MGSRLYVAAKSWRVAAVLKLSPKARRSGPHGVFDAFLGEACLSSAGELLLGRLARAGSRCVFLAFRHEALERRAGKVLVGSLGFARGRLLRKGGCRECRKHCCKQHLLHRILLRLRWTHLPPPAELDGEAVVYLRLCKNPVTRVRPGGRLIAAVPWVMAGLSRAIPIAGAGPPYPPPGLPG